MPDSARTEIIARVRRASQGAAATDIERELNQLAPIPDIVAPGDNPAEAFIINVLKNQGTAEIVPSRSEATKATAQYLYQHFRTRKLVAGNDPRLAAMPWRDGGVLPRFGAAVDGDFASISYARLGVVDTGSIVTWTGKSNPATNNLLVEAHIVLVDLADLVATMEQAWENINAIQANDRRPRGISFISGPSSTADIELQLVMGAHGPRHWHVILIDDVPEETSL